MAVRIRLRRIGKNPRKRPYFRVSVFEDSNARDGKFIEELGFYNPLDGSVKLNKERVEFWLKNGAQPSETIKSLIKRSLKNSQN